jgi:hypothetical protein
VVQGVSRSIKQHTLWLPRDSIGIRVPVAESRGTTGYEATSTNRNNRPNVLNAATTSQTQNNFKLISPVYSNCQTSIRTFPSRRIKRQRRESTMAPSSADAMLCRVCSYPGSDLRLIGCGCTVHAVSNHLLIELLSDSIVSRPRGQQQAPFGVRLRKNSSGQFYFFRDVGTSSSWLL